MASHKRPATLSTEETYLDDPWNEVNSEWEKTTQDPVKRRTFERECIEDDFTKQFQLEGQPNQYYHVSCMEQIFPDLSTLVQRGILQMGGGVNQLTEASWQVSRFHNAIEDWFRYNGRTFDVKIYDRFHREHAEWDQKASTIEINHQLGARGGSSKDCEKCEEVPDEPLRRDYFPEEPRNRLLSEVLASVIGVRQLDGVDGNLNARRGKKILRR
ncbi:hypothetical protein N7489_011722 [Penicillium chrysogenum]|uniref:uncharacterized protein n=1 Tax=Penicillium chrysogenum TaxID=5076 RepID=UPI0024DF1B4C|nr:uncharacterized protein N7489_011722 [Penicillium chrysogenum]KAJ5231014.1 hypothetical protein N7489_011722 [Penicillium chrysogenum]